LRELDVPEEFLEEPYVDTDDEEEEEELYIENIEDNIEEEIKHYIG